MDSQEIDLLLERLRSGQASEADKTRIERLLSEGEIGMNEIESTSGLQDQIARVETPEPSASLDRRFYAMLSAEQTKASRTAWWRELFAWPTLAPRMAFASLMLIIGVAAGYLWRSSASSSDEQIAVLSQEVTDLREMMMLSLLEKGSATERLKAVGLTDEMDEASKKVTSALIQTLNHDENINVRLAALEALKPYVTDSAVREALIRSIPNQESPLVQISLAELMVALHEKAAVKEFEKLMESGRTPPEIRKKIQESIEVLI